MDDVFDRSLRETPLGGAHDLDHSPVGASNVPWAGTLARTVAPAPATCWIWRFVASTAPGPVPFPTRTVTWIVSPSTGAGVFVSIRTARSEGVPPGPLTTMTAVPTTLGIDTDSMWTPS